MTTEVKVRHNKGNQTYGVGIPRKYMAEFKDIRFFECTRVENGLLYIPVNTSDKDKVCQDVGCDTT